MEILGLLGMVMMCAGAFWLCVGPEYADATPSMWLLCSGWMIFVIGLALEISA